MNLEPGVIYHIYDGVEPIREGDKDQLKLMKDTNKKLITKKAICTCGVVKETFTMFTALCKKCSKKQSRANHDNIKRYDTQKAKDQCLKQFGKPSNGNSIWL